MTILNLVGKWYSPGMGAYPGGYAEFTDTRIIIEVVNIEESFEERTTLKYGSFTVSGNKLFIDIGAPNIEILEGELHLNRDEFGFVTSFWLIIDGTYYNTEPDYGA